MPTERVDPKQLWAEWTRDAISQYEPPEDIPDEDLVDDMVAFTTDYASAMLDAFEEVFGPIDGRHEPRSTPRGARAKKTRGRRRDNDGADGND